MVCRLSDSDCSLYDTASVASSPFHPFFPLLTLSLSIHVVTCRLFSLSLINAYANMPFFFSLPSSSRSPSTYFPYGSSCLPNPPRPFCSVLCLGTFPVCSSCSWRYASSRTPRKQFFGFTFLYLLRYFYDHSRLVLGSVNICPCVCECPPSSRSTPTVRDGLERRRHSSFED